MRYTFAVRFVSARGAPNVLQSLLGHHSARFSLEVYSKARAEDQKDAIQAMEAWSDKKGPKLAG